MRKKLVAIFLALSLGACAAPPTNANGPQPDPGGAAVLSVLGTPFLLALKLPICTATLLVAAPAAGASELDPQGGMARRVLADGVAQNCGPPYAVTPY